MEIMHVNRDGKKKSRRCRVLRVSQKKYETFSEFFVSMLLMLHFMLIQVEESEGSCNVVINGSIIN